MPTVHVQLEERDYVRAARAAARPGRRILIALGIGSALVIVGALLGWRAGYMREALIAAFVWFFGLIGAGIGQMLSIAPKAKRVFRQQHGLRRTHEITWTDTGLTVSGEDGQSTTRWTDFHKARELDDQFLLFLSDAIFLMIPKRAFPDSSLLQSFRESIASSIARK
ncbi:MAG: YcxB family protein [Vicinamibacterales bacterium]